MSSFIKSENRQSYFSVELISMIGFDDKELSEKDDLL